MNRERVELEALARDVGGRIGHVVEQLGGKDADGKSKIGFAFFVFTFGEGGNLAYISSADREGVIGSLKEWLARQETGISTDPIGRVGGES